MSLNTHHLAFRVYISTVGLLITAAAGTMAQDTWSLERCIDHAIKNSIQIRKLRLDSLQARSSQKQAAAAQLPGVSANAGYSLSQQTAAASGPTPSDCVNQSTRYSLNAGWTVFKGTGIRTNVKQKRLMVQQADASISEAENSIVMAVVHAYLKVLNARESEKNAGQSLELSTAQLDRVRGKADAGAASAVDLARMESQHAQDRYNQVVARNNLARAILDLKQLLEIPVEQDFVPEFPVFADPLRLPPLPDKKQLYETARAQMPEMQKSRLEIEIARLEAQKAVAGYLPTVSLSAGIATSQSASSSSPAARQLGDNFDPSAGAQISIPIYDNRSAKTAVEKARLLEQRAHLDVENAEKSLLSAVESAYQDAEAARSRLEAAQVRLAAAQKSYELAQQQFDLGMISSADLLAEKSAFLSAQNEQVQAKYSAIVFTEILNVYQCRPVALPEEVPADNAR